jgi:hypothetical protein
MKKSSVWAIIFFLSGIVCFLIAGYFFQTYQNIFKTFASYGVPEIVIYSNEELANAILNLKFGIAKFIIIGLAALIAGAFFIWRRVKNL